MQTHDYTNRYFGHDYTLMSVEKDNVKIAGWGSGLKVNDYILIQAKDEKSSKLQILEIDYKKNTNNMWFAKAKWIINDNEKTIL